MQFQVPQFIETEDKIVGPFTLRQFMYVAGAGLGSAILYFTVATWLWFILTIILLGGAIGVAFVKVRGAPWVMSFFRRSVFIGNLKRIFGNPEEQTMARATTEPRRKRHLS